MRSLLLIVIFCWTLFFPMSYVIAEDAEADTQTKSEQIPYKVDNQEIGSLIGKIFLIMVVLIGLSIAVLWFYRQYLYGKSSHLRSEGNINLCGFKRISPKLNVYIIEVDEVQYVIAENKENLAITKHEKNSKNTL